ncbi:MAG: hypothetical protein WBB32_01845 [Flavobacteriales bacterium]
MEAFWRFGFQASSGELAFSQADHKTDPWKLTRTLMLSDPALGCIPSAAVQAAYNLCHPYSMADQDLKQVT